MLASILGYGLVRGLFNGFFLELASLVSLIAGIFIAVKFSSVLADVLAKKVSWDPLAVRLVSFAVLVLAVIIAISLLAKIFTTMASFAGLGIMNRILGGVFGMMKLALIAGTLLVTMARYDLPGTETRESSLLYGPVTGVGKLLYPSLTDWVPAGRDLVRA